MRGGFGVGKRGEEKWGEERGGTNLLAGLLHDVHLVPVPLGRVHVLSSS